MWRNAETGETNAPPPPADPDAPKITHDAELQPEEAMKVRLCTPPYSTDNELPTYPMSLLTAYVFPPLSRLPLATVPLSASACACFDSSTRLHRQDKLKAQGYDTSEPAEGAP